jgi:hypothetical protein
MEEITAEEAWRGTKKHMNHPRARRVYYGIQ